MNKNNEQRIKVLSKFVNSPTKDIDWNFVMLVIEKIESIIEEGIEIRNNRTVISWSYSPKKTGTFDKGAGGGGGWTENRTPFEPIFGKDYQIEEKAETKIEAVCNACFKWIKWYKRRKL